MTTPQRLERLARNQAEAADRAAGRRRALERFYAALSPEQQRVFDALGRLTGPGGSAPDDPRPGREGPRPGHGAG